MLDCVFTDVNEDLRYLGKQEGTQFSQGVLKRVKNDKENDMVYLHYYPCSKD